MNELAGQSYRPAEGVLSQAVHGEIVLLDLRREQYFGLNEVGARVWVLLDGGASLEGLTARLLEEYEVDRKQLTADLEALLAELLRRGLVVREASG